MPSSLLNEVGDGPSIVEATHVSITAMVLKLQECAFMEAFPSEEQTRVLKTIETLILVRSCTLSAVAEMLAICTSTYR